MYTASVMYVGDLPRMQAFYEQCFELAALDSGPGYVGLSSGAWLLTLVQSPQAFPTTNPAQPRVGTPIKLAFEVRSIDALRPIVTTLGGRINPSDTKWEFRGATHCDCLDPEGNVVQLITSDSP